MKGTVFEVKEALNLVTLTKGRKGKLHKIKLILEKFISDYETWDKLFLYAGHADSEGNWYITQDDPNYMVSNLIGLFNSCKNRHTTGVLLQFSCGVNVLRQTFVRTKTPLIFICVNNPKTTNTNYMKMIKNTEGELFVGKRVKEQFVKIQNRR